MAKKRKKKSQARAGADAAHEPERRPAAQPKPVAQTKPGARVKTGPQPLDAVLLGLAGLGIALTVYLTGVAWFGDTPAYCNAGSGCDLVQSSRWSTLLGVPVSLWGLLTYLLLARFIWRLRTHASAWPAALLMAALGAAISWYLTVVSVLQIEATCGYCLASLIIMNLLLIGLLLRRPAHLPEHAWGKALPMPLAVSAMAVLVLHLHYSGIFDPAAGPEDPYLRDLAIHLKDSGARFYGAYWCPVCLDQKAMFEASAERLPYVECTPAGRSGPVSMACANAGVRDYPTWVIGDVRHGGVLSPQRLASMSGFKGNLPSASR